MAYVSGTRTNTLSLGTRLGEIRTAFAEAFAAWRLYRTTLKQLRELSDRELEDLGLSRTSLPRIAREATYGVAK